MVKSFLSSFAMNMNRTVSIDNLVRTKNNIGELVDGFVPSGYYGVKCLILPTSYKIRQYMADKQIEGIEVTHSIRLELGVTVLLGDRITDNRGEVYSVKYVAPTQGFDGDDDHLFILSQKIV